MKPEITDNLPIADTTGNNHNSAALPRVRNAQVCPFKSCAREVGYRRENGDTNAAKQAVPSGEKDSLLKCDVVASLAAAIERRPESVDRQSIAENE